MSRWRKQNNACTGLLAHAATAICGGTGMTTSHESFYSGIDGALTPEQALQALAMEATGDTGVKPDTSGAPTTTTASDAKGDGETDTNSEQKPGDTAAPKADAPQVIPEDQQTADNTVVLAKDGKHTIDFGKLQEARQQRDQYKAQAETAEAAAQAAQQQLAALQAAAQSRADAGQAPTKTDNMAATAAAAIEAGADASLFGDFSETALTEGISKLVAQQVAAQVQVQVAKAVEPMQAKHQQDASSEHYDAIYKAHPNADSMVQSREFAAWVDAHPSAVRNAYWDLFDGEKGGSAAQIVEVFDAFKAATEKPSPQPAADAKAAAKAAVDGARTEPPSSLTSIPGGRASGSSVLDATADMSGPEMMQATATMSPAQIEAWLNKQI